MRDWFGIAMAVLFLVAIGVYFLIFGAEGHYGFRMKIATVIGFVVLAVFGAAPSPRLAYLQTT